MEIFIFSAGRANLAMQHTLRELSPVAKVAIVVQHHEANAYGKFHSDLIVLPKNTPRTLPAARACVAKANAGKKILMLDDDLSFAKRRGDDPTKFLAASHKDLKAMLASIERSLDKYAHVGLCSREGGNRFTADQQATRMSRVLAYNMAKVPTDVQFDRVLLPEDFDVTLQLLVRGLPNLVLSGYCHNQPGSNTDGGCSVYRSIEVHNEAMRKFGELWPWFVKIVEKQTKTSWGGQPRLDAVVQWKKAYAASQKGAL